MAKVEMYTTGTCPFCIGAKELLDAKGVGYDEIRVDKERGKREEMMERAQRRTVPQIFIGEHHVGGHDELVQLERRGELDGLLAETD